MIIILFIFLIFFNTFYIGLMVYTIIEKNLLGNIQGQKLAIKEEKLK